MCRFIYTAQSNPHTTIHCTHTQAKMAKRAAKEKKMQQVVDQNKKNMSEKRREWDQQRKHKEEQHKREAVEVARQEFQANMSLLEQKRKNEKVGVSYMWVCVCVCIHAHTHISHTWHHTLADGHDQGQERGGAEGGPAQCQGGES